MTDETRPLLTLPAGTRSIDTDEQERALASWLRSHRSAGYPEITPIIPPARLANAAEACRIPAGEPNIALIHLDSGAAKECLVVTRQAVCWREGTKLPVTRIPLAEFAGLEIEWKGWYIAVGADRRLLTATWSYHQFLVILQKALREGIQTREIPPSEKGRWTFSLSRGLFLGLAFCGLTALLIKLRSTRSGDGEPILLIVALFVAILFFGFRKRAPS